ncbi:calcineurin binding protein [Histoplasma capsulatum var. duboisii H88]|uniref:Calcineurin binding protein n=1 Tax=Ajellomyces capsulatus (strain H88) TaxID=544711 RepID=F0UIY0_AJEC8|nr:calcineurin binding protein [Histoplasma capsulatum var. duboisii H88]QSS57106.1 calcineurin binding protein [Histoplasma capsulatum var. duboisii H88]
MLRQSASSTDSFSSADSPSSHTATCASRASPSPSERKKGLSLDLSNLPPPIQPSPPSNTLLITELYDLSLFQPSSLDAIKAQISRITPLNSFSPLPSLRRIVCSFTSIPAAIRIRQLLDGEAILGKNVRARVYFGENTPVEDAEERRKRNLLEAPKSQKLFFISPPPSPPHGWMMRNEGPPNKEVHATDLAEALGRLGTITTDATGSDGFDSAAAAAAAGGIDGMAAQDPDTPISISSDVYMHGNDQEGSSAAARRASYPRAPGLSGERSGSSTLIYDPEHHGSSPHLPAVMVEDTTVGGDVSDMEMEMEMDNDSFGLGKRIIAHTARPPVELME